MRSSRGGRPLLNPRWRVRVAHHPTIEKLVSQLRAAQSRSGQSRPCPACIRWPWATWCWCAIRAACWPSTSPPENWSGRPNRLATVVVDHWLSLGTQPQPLGQSQFDLLVEQRIWDDPDLRHDEQRRRTGLHRRGSGRCLANQPTVVRGPPAVPQPTGRVARPLQSADRPRTEDRRQAEMGSRRHDGRRRAEAGRRLLPRAAAGAARPAVCAGRDERAGNPPGRPLGQDRQARLVAATLRRRTERPAGSRTARRRSRPPRLPTACWSARLRPGPSWPSTPPPATCCGAISIRGRSRSTHLNAMRMEHVSARTAHRRSLGRQHRHARRRKSRRHADRVRLSLRPQPDQRRSAVEDRARQQSVRGLRSRRQRDRRRPQSGHRLSLGRRRCRSGPARLATPDLPDGGMPSGRGFQRATITFCHWPAPR